MRWLIAVSLLALGGCASCGVPQQSVFQPPVGINTPGVYQQAPAEMEHV